MGKEDYISLGAKEPLKVMVRAGEQLKVCKQRNGIVEVALCKEEETGAFIVVRIAVRMSRSTLGES